MYQVTQLSWRKFVSITLVLFLTLLKVEQANAGVLQARPKSSSKSEKRVCLANLTRKNGDCIISRGGSTDTSEPLKQMGPWFSFRTLVAQKVSGFWSEAEQTKFFLAGAVAGIISRTAVSPLEVIATAQMVRGGNNNIIGELVDLFSNEGISGFFKGNGANCLKVAPTRGIQFFAFESFKTRLVSWKKTSLGLSEDADITLTPVERLLAGGVAGMCASSIVYPLEVVKTMLTMYPGKYSGIQSAFLGVINEVGPKGLYQGLAPTLVAMFPYVGVEFMIYETAKIAVETFINNRGEGEVDSKGKIMIKTIPLIISLGLGAVAGAAAQTSAHPLDVVRKRLQVQGINGNPILYKNTFECFAGVAKKDGIGALYRGLGPACVATIPGTGIAYISYEVMKNALGLSSL